MSFFFLGGGGSSNNYGDIFTWKSVPKNREVWGLLKHSCSRQETLDKEEFCLSGSTYVDLWSTTQQFEVCHMFGSLYLTNVGTGFSSSYLSMRPSISIARALLRHPQSAIEGRTVPVLLMWRSAAWNECGFGHLRWRYLSTYSPTAAAPLLRASPRIKPRSAFSERVVARLKHQLTEQLRRWNNSTWLHLTYIRSTGYEQLVSCISVRGQLSV
jgi:hypothetical protein